MSSKNVKSLSLEHLESIARLFDVLSEASRLLILQTLRTNSLTVTEIVEQTGLKQANVSKQLGILYGAKLLSKTKNGNWIHYAIADPRIFELCDVVCGKIKEDAKKTVRMF